MNIERLRIFIQVVDCGSLSKAATINRVGASALSRQLAALEEECGGRLVHRTGRGVALTELGERILPSARSLLKESLRFSNEVLEASGVCRGTVHVGCVQTLASRLLTPLFLLVRQKFPEVRLHAVTGMSGQVEQWIAEGSVDLGFVIRHDVGRPPPEDHVLVMKSPICLVGPSDNHLTSKKEIDFARLDGVPLIQPGVGSSRQSLEELASSMDVNLNIVAEADSLDLMKNLVSQQVGYALLLESSIHDEVADGRLSASKLVNPSLTAQVCLVNSPGKSSGRASREISSLARQMVNNLQI